VDEKIFANRSHGFEYMIKRKMEEELRKKSDKKRLMKKTNNKGWTMYGRYTGWVTCRFLR